MVTRLLRDTYGDIITLDLVDNKVKGLNMMLLAWVFELKDGEHAQEVIFDRFTA